jgi:hypothetical protein
MTPCMLDPFNSVLVSPGSGGPTLRRALLHVPQCDSARATCPGACSFQAFAGQVLRRCRVRGEIRRLALVGLCHGPQLSGTVPPLVFSMAMIMPTSKPLGLAWEPATVNIPNAAWVLVMLQAPVRPSLGVGPGVAAATPAPAPLAASVRAVTRRVVRALIWYLLRV